MFGSVPVLEHRTVQADTGTAKKTALYRPTPGRPRRPPCTGRHRDGQEDRPVQADTGTAKKTALYRPTPERPRRPPCTGRHRNGQEDRPVQADTGTAKKTALYRPTPERPQEYHWRKLPQVPFLSRQTRIFSQQKYACRNKINICLSRQNIFAAEKLLSRQLFVDKHKHVRQK